MHLKHVDLPQILHFNCGYRSFDTTNPARRGPLFESVTFFLQYQIILNGKYIYASLS